MTPDNPVWLQALDDVTRILAGEAPPAILPQNAGGIRSPFGASSRRWASPLPEQFPVSLTTVASDLQ